MATFGEPLRTGSLAGISRARDVGLLRDRVEPDAFVAIDDALNTAERLLDGSESPRFAALFGELVSVAAIARVAYGEKPLNRRAISWYLIISKRFFNSWVHRDEDRYP